MVFDIDWQGTEKIVSKQLLKIIMSKQAMMRGLCKRLVELETGGKVKRVSFKG